MNDGGIASMKEQVDLLQSAVVKAHHELTEAVNARYEYGDPRTIALAKALYRLKHPSYEASDSHHRFPVISDPVMRAGKGTAICGAIMPAWATYLDDARIMIEAEKSIESQP